VQRAFVVAHGDSSKLFELAEEVPDQVARFLELLVRFVTPLLFACV
jgi:hypothetical protein